MADVFTFELDVRYIEIDQQGVVFNAWYLMYFDEAMTAFLSHRGLSYDALRTGGHDVMLVHSEIDWRDGLRWGDRAAIDVSCARAGRTSFALDFRARRGEDVVVEAQTVYAVVATDGSGARTIPRPLRQALEPVQPLRSARASG